MHSNRTPLEELEHYLQQLNSTSMGRRTFLAAVPLLMAACASGPQHRHREGDNSGQATKLSVEDEKKMTEYERQVHEEKQRVYKSYYRDLNRVVTFICIYDGYVTEHMTQERYSDVIERMEIEIFDGDPTIKGPREILIDVGEAIDLSVYYADFKKEKKATIAKVTDLIFSEISTMLTKLDEGRTHRFIDAKTLV